MSANLKSSRLSAGNSRGTCARLTKLLKAAHFPAYRKTRCFPAAGKDGSERDEENLGDSRRRGKAVGRFSAEKCSTDGHVKARDCPTFATHLSI